MSPGAGRSGGRDVRADATSGTGRWFFRAGEGPISPSPGLRRDDGAGGGRATDDEWIRAGLHGGRHVARSPRLTSVGPRRVVRPCADGRTAADPREPIGTVTDTAAPLGPARRHGDGHGRSPRSGPSTHASGHDDPAGPPHQV